MLELCRQGLLIKEDKDFLKSYHFVIRLLMKKVWDPRSTLGRSFTNREDCPDRDLSCLVNKVLENPHLQILYLALTIWPLWWTKRSGRVCRLKLDMA